MQTKMQREGLFTLGKSLEGVDCLACLLSSIAKTILQSVHPMLIRLTNIIHDNICFHPITRIEWIRIVKVSAVRVDLVAFFVRLLGVQRGVLTFEPHSVPFRHPPTVVLGAIVVVLAKP